VFVCDAIDDRVAMKTNFRIVGLPLAQFEPAFSLDDNELAQKGARRLMVNAKPGFPCRVSLQDADIGERVILMPFGPSRRRVALSRIRAGLCPRDRERS
jgi:hypothetical protein